MRTSILYLSLVFVISCGKDPNVMVDHINGYWEIQEVTMENGLKKQYAYNDTIDYIQLNDSLIGFRKKLKPGFNNTYTTSKDAEAITGKIEDNSLVLYYKTPYAEWTETVIDANDEYLTIMNENKAVYLYKRYQSLKLDIEE
ncbi:MAG: hypothetical protein AAF901_07150 [Bacteroidota bacterium]